MLEGGRPLPEPGDGKAGGARTLADLIAAKSPELDALNPRGFQSHAVELLRAVCEAHKSGLVGLRIAASRVLLTAAGQLQLAVSDAKRDGKMSDNEWATSCSQGGMPAVLCAPLLRCAAQTFASCADLRDLGIVLYQRLALIVYDYPPDRADALAKILAAKLQTHPSPFSPLLRRMLMHLPTPGADHASYAKQLLDEIQAMCVPSRHVSYCRWFACFRAHPCRCCCSCRAQRHCVGAVPRAQRAACG